MDAPSTPCSRTLKAARLLFSKDTPANRTNLRINKVKEATHTSWWDSAAVQITASSPAKGICVLARGRNHARADVRDVAKWRDAAFDQFLGTVNAAKPEPTSPQPSTAH